MHPDIQALLDAAEVVWAKAFKLSMTEMTKQRLADLCDTCGFVRSEDGSVVDCRKAGDYEREMTGKQIAEWWGALDKLDAVSDKLPATAGAALAAAPTAEVAIRRLQQAMLDVITAAGMANAEQMKAICDLKQDLQYAIEPIRKDPSLAHFFLDDEKDDPDDFDEEDFDGYNYDEEDDFVGEE